MDVPQSQTVPSWAVLILAFILPPICFCGFTLIEGRPRAELLRLLLTLAIANLLTAAITNCLKIAVSRPRPNFLAACWPAPAVASWNAVSVSGKEYG